MRSGRPPEVLVPDGSAPEKLGEKYWPVWKIPTQASFHPPITASAARGACGRNRAPLPNGNCHTAFTKTRCLGKKSRFQWLGSYGFSRFAKFVIACAHVQEPSKLTDPTRRWASNSIESYL